MNSKEYVKPMDNMPDLLKKETQYKVGDVELENVTRPLNAQRCETNDAFESIQNKQKHFCDAIKAFFKFDNENHRRNFIQSSCVFVNFVLLGWTYGQLGTAFQDIQLLLNINIKQISLVFTANSIGWMIGGLSIGFLTEKFDTLLLIGVLTILTGGLGILQAFAPYHIVFLIIRFLSGVFGGGVDSGGNAKVCACWGVSVRPIMVALHFGYGLGGVLSPLATVYFLAPRLDDILHMNQTLNTTILLNNSLNNATISPLDFSSYSEVTTTSMRNVIAGVRYGETKITTAFIMTGILTIASGCFYIILYIKGYGKTPQYVTKPYQNSSQALENKHKRIKLTKRQTVAFMLFLSLGVLCYAAVECKLQTFLMPFVVLELDWTKIDAAFLISLVWIFYSIGRFSGITISRFVSPRTMIVVFFSMTIASTAGIWIGAVTRINALIWIFVPCSGFSISVLWPTFLNWFNENLLQVNGRISGYFLVCGCMGFLLDPLYIGLLMENVSPMYFVYIQIGQAAFGLSVYCTLFMVVRSFQKRNV